MYQLRRSMPPTSGGRLRVINKMRDIALRLTSVVIAAEEKQIGDLLGYQPDKEYQHCRDEQQRTHDSEMVSRYERVDVPCQSQQEKHNADRQKYLQRRV